MNSEPIILDPTERFPLHKSDSLFFVAEGEINIFLLTPKSREASEGPLTYLRTVVQGELIVPFSPEHVKNRSVLAVAYKKTVMYERPISDIKEGEVSTLLENWMLGFSSILTSKKTPPIDQYLENGLKFSFPAGQNVMFPNAALSDNHLNLVWLRVLQGRLSLLTLPDFELSPASPPFPLIPLTTFQTLEDSIVEIETNGPYWEGVSLFNKLVLSKLIASQDEHSLQEQTSLAVLSQYEGDRKEKLFHNVKTLFSRVGYGGKEQSGDETVQTLRVLENALQQPLLEYETSLTSGGSTAVINPIIRQRDVTLKKDWWHHDSRPLLGRLDERSFVALIPDPPGGYLMIKPGNPEPERVNEALAKQLGPTASMFYRVFSDKGKLSFLKILQFGLAGRFKDILICLGAALLAVFLSLFVTTANSLIFDFVIPSADPRLLWQIVGGLCIAAIVGAIFTSAREASILRLEGYAYHDLGSTVWQHTLDLPMNFFRRFSTGDLIQRLDGFGMIRGLLSGHAIRTVINTVFSVSFLLVMLYYSPLLTAVLLGLLFILGVILMSCLYFSSKIVTIMEQANGILYGKSIQTINGISKIRTNAAETRFFDNWESHYLTIKELELKAGRIRIMEILANRLFPQFAFLLILVIFILVGMREAAGKEGGFISIGSYMAFYAAFSGFYLAFTTFCGILAVAVRCNPLWNRMKVVLEEPRESAERELKYQVGPLTGEVRLDHIFFRYDPNSAYIHNDISLYAEPGEFIAIVGPSGCGKSSLVRILLGFEKPEMGAVYYNGKDLKDLDLRDVRSQIGTVLQNSMIMHGSIRDNITGGRLASDKEIMRAVQMAAFDTDLAAMPMGLSTPLISGGAGLSGGQRQRLFMARVLLGEPKILILDEATNALDNITQERMVSNLDNIHVTRIVIAHRLSTIRKAHRIYVLDKGRIAQTGTFDELVAQKGIFADFVKNQKL